MEINLYRRMSRQKNCQSKGEIFKDDFRKENSFEETAWKKSGKEQQRLNWLLYYCNLIAQMAELVDLFVCDNRQAR